MLQADADSDAILCDLLMDQGSCADLHAWLRVALPELSRSVLFCTASARAAASAALEIPADRIVTKPLDFPALLTRLTALHDQRDAAGTETS